MTTPSVLLKKQLKERVEVGLASPKLNGSTTSTPTSPKSWFEMLEHDEYDDTQLYSDEHFQRITTPDVLQPLSSPVLSSDDEAQDTDEEDLLDDNLGDQSPLSSTHLLRNKWTIYYDQGFKQGASPEDYEQSIKQVGAFDSIEEFWRYWNNINLPYNRMPSYLNIRLFKSHIKPLYEDPRNIDGGRWVIQTHNKETRKETWNEIVLAIIGEKHFTDKYEVSGIVLSSRKTYDAIQIWNGCMLDRKHIQFVMRKIRKILQSVEIDKTTTIEYQANRGVKKYNEKENIKKSVLKALKTQVRFTSFSPPSSPSLNSPSFSPSLPKLLSPLSNPAHMVTASDLLPPLSLEQVESEIIKDEQAKNMSTSTAANSDNKQKSLYSAGHSIGRVSGGFVIGRGFHLNSSRSRLQSQTPQDTQIDSPTSEDEILTSQEKPSSCNSKQEDSKHSKVDRKSKSIVENRSSKNEVSGIKNADLLKLISVFVFVIAVIWQVIVHTTK